MNRGGTISVDDVAMAIPPTSAGPPPRRRSAMDNHVDVDLSGYSQSSSTTSTLTSYDRLVFVESSSNNNSSSGGTPTSTKPSRLSRPSQLTLQQVSAAGDHNSAGLGPSSNSTIDDCVAVRVAGDVADPSRAGYPRVENNRLMRLKIPYDTASKDSDSLINDAYYYETERFDSHSCWWSHPKVRQNWKIVLSAFILLIIGTGLVVAGFLVEIMPIAGFKGIVFFIAGAICFIPGAYHVVYVYCAVKGRRGFDFTSLPLFT